MFCGNSFDHEDRAGNPGEAREQRAEDKERAADQQAGTHEAQIERRLGAIIAQQIGVTARSNEIAIAGQVRPLLAQ